MLINNQQGPQTVGTAEPKNKRSMVLRVHQEQGFCSGDYLFLAL